ILKVPMQFFILLTGVMVFVFYQFNSSPLHFNPVAVQAIENSEYATEYHALELQQEENFIEKKQLLFAYTQASSASEKEESQLQIVDLDQKDKSFRQEAKSLFDKAGIKAETNDKDYVFIHFILNHLPKGLIGLLLAVILSAAMSSTSSELNALATTTTMDLYRRNKGNLSEKHYLLASKGFTLLWGCLAILFACVANLFDNLIQLVNTI